MQLCMEAILSFVLKDLSIFVFTLYIDYMFCILFDCDFV